MDHLPGTSTGYPDLPSIFELFEDVFQLTLTPDQKVAFTREVAVGWNNTDDSEQSFVDELLQIYASYMGLAAADRWRSRSTIELGLRAAMATPRADDCGRVLHVLNSIVVTADRARMLGSSFSREELLASTLRNMATMRKQIGDPIARNLHLGDPSESPSAAPGSSLGAFPPGPVWSPEPASIPWFPPGTDMESKTTPTPWFPPGTDMDSPPPASHRSVDSLQSVQPDADGDIPAPPPGERSTTGNSNDPAVQRTQSALAGEPAAPRSTNAPPSQAELKAWVDRTTNDTFRKLGEIRIAMAARRW